MPSQSSTVERSRVRHRDIEKTDSGGSIHRRLNTPWHPVSASQHGERVLGFSCVALDRLWYCDLAPKPCRRAREVAADHIPSMPIDSVRVGWRHGGYSWRRQFRSETHHCLAEGQRDNVDPVRGWGRRRCKRRLGSRMQEASIRSCWYTGRASLKSQGWLATSWPARNTFGQTEDGSLHGQPC